MEEKELGNIKRKLEVLESFKDFLFIHNSGTRFEASFVIATVSIMLSYICVNYDSIKKELFLTYVITFALAVAFLIYSMILSKREVTNDVYEEINKNKELQLELTLFKIDSKDKISYGELKKYIKKSIEELKAEKLRIDVEMKNKLLELYAK